MGKILVFSLICLLSFVGFLFRNNNYRLNGLCNTSNILAAAFVSLFGAIGALLIQFHIISDRIFLILLFVGCLVPIIFIEIKRNR